MLNQWYYGMDSINDVILNDFYFRSDVRSLEQLRVEWLVCGEYLLIGENGAWKMPSKGLTAESLPIENPKWRWNGVKFNSNVKSYFSWMLWLMYQAYIVPNGWPNYFSIKRGRHTSKLIYLLISFRCHKIYHTTNLLLISDTVMIG